ncbi:SPX domain-containing protein [Gaertneriomyces semiglobifer]|nr:SPX domain-containing protein [Gaertneriomyces semiglobifer]
MKFAKQYTEAYRELPSHWPAFQYKALKKSIRRIVEELEEKGILVTEQADDAGGESGAKVVRHCTVEYFLGGSADNLEPFVMINLADETSGTLPDIEELPEATEAEAVARSSEAVDFPQDDDETFRPPSKKPSNLSLQSLLLEEQEEEEEGMSFEVEHTSATSGSVRIHLAPRRRSRPTFHIEDDSGQVPLLAPEAVVEASEPIPIPCKSAASTDNHLSTSPVSSPLLSPSSFSTVSDFSTSPSSAVSGSQLGRPSARRTLCIKADALMNINSISSPRGSFTAVESPGGSVIKLFLKTDHQFFHDLATAVNSIAQFEANLKDEFHRRMDELSSYLVTAASPYSKDMYVWREVLSLYLQQQIWFVRGFKDRPMESAREQLLSFQEIVQTSIRAQFRSPGSTLALQTFLRMNHEMLAVKQFDEINHTAVRKILKKHDKRTQLTASRGFTEFLETQSFFAGSIARVLIFSIQERLTTVIPQPDDHLCPICQDVYWKPIRLVCGHIFCVRCLVKAQARHVRHCPICRHHDAVATANADQLDIARMNLIKLYFPKEVKRKARDNSRERGAEEYQKIMTLQNVNGAGMAAVGAEGTGRHGESGSHGEGTVATQPNGECIIL